MEQPRTIEFREDCVIFPMPIVPFSAIVPFQIDHNEVMLSPDNVVPSPPINVKVEQAPIHQQVSSRRYERIRKPNLHRNFIYLLEHEFNVGDDSYPSTFHKAIFSSYSSNWMKAMQEELKSMDQNGVWDLMKLSMRYKIVGCKWVFKTKYDSRDEIERYKARLVTKGYSQREGIDYRETFSPVSTKESFHVIMALVAHFNLKLYQMDVKTTFLNDKLLEDMYMNQPDGFIKQGKEYLICKLNIFTHGLK